MEILFGRKRVLAAAAFAAVILCVLLFAGPQAVSGQENVKQEQASSSGPENNKTVWSVRCNAQESDPVRECEAYQRLVVAQSGQRVAEFAVGFPKDKKDGRGVIVLPLGILLNDGIEMQIDDGQKFKFKPRYCTQEGCFAFVTIDAALLDVLKKGSVTQFSAKAMNGKDVRIKMTLRGLTAALKRAADS